MPAVARVRRASHAGSWYTDDPVELSAQLSSWLDAAKPSHPPARAIIAPHAGYSFSGPTAAWAYKHLVPDEAVRRVFLLGPSHSLYSPRCLLTSCQAYATPIGALRVDEAVRDELAATGEFDEMTLAVDEREHSLEMHLPYIVHVMGGRPFTLVPIMVGALSEASEARYGRLLAPYLSDRQNLFVISTDFCHWGARFNFTYRDPRHGNEIFHSVEALDRPRTCTPCMHAHGCIPLTHARPLHVHTQALDRQGMALIEAQDAQGFADYETELGNTICGRHAVSVFLHALNAQPEGHTLKFVRYAQSSQARRADDSSVSYASAVVCPPCGPGHGPGRGPAEVLDRGPLPPAGPVG